MTAKTYDQKCYELAEYFLQDELNSAANRHELSCEIQTTIEDWFHDKRRKVILDAVRELSNE